MKFATLAAVVATTAAFTAAQPHKHHQHQHARRGANVVTVFELNGNIISAQEVQEGLENGTLIIDGHGGPVAAAGSGSGSDSAPVVKPAAPAAANSARLTVDIGNKSPVKPAAKPAPAQQGSDSPPAQHGSASPPAVIAGAAPHASSLHLSLDSKTPSVSVSGSSGSGSFSMSATGLDAPFPDGQLSCSTFPSKYGALAVPWMNIGGWSGIQAPGNSISGFIDNIMTKVGGQCSGSDCCSEGEYCSYACPPGYQKSQWPSTQGATGQSVGGLLCQGGKLHLTNPSLSKSLCMKGASEVSIQVKNIMSEVAAVCRTEYPGTESMVIPLSATPGSTTPLTCPDQSNYYTWGGKTTSAQYYVNPKGVAVSEACNWGSSSVDIGNWAPLNLGVSYNPGDSTAYLGIFQNAPTTNQKLDFSVEVVGENGGFSNIPGKCRYKAGQYCSGVNYESCNTQGCTAAVSHGTATFIFSD